MNEQFDEFQREHPAWRRPAPRARRLAMALYAWQDPGWVFLFAIAAAMPFVLAAAFSPALLSFAPTTDMIAPIAAARAVVAGNAALSDQSAPFHVLLLVLADLLVDTPGRVHLVAKALAAALVAYPLAYIAAARFPAGQAVLLTVAAVAGVAAPFAGVHEIALVFFVALSAALLCAPADESRDRAHFEGVIAGALLFGLWTLSAPFALMGFLALSACPFLTGRSGLDRYLAAMVSVGVMAGIAELLAPGINAARAIEASGLVALARDTAGGASWGLAGVGVSTVIVVAAAAVFGGREHWKSWATAAVFLIFAAAAARLSGAPAPLVFALAAAIACLSVASPFYDGVFRHHDRASIAIAASVAAMTMFWTASLVINSVGQMALQHRTALAARADIRAEFGLVQPGGPTIARWVEEGRFSTPEARELLALAPVDQSAMLLEVAGRARDLAGEGVDVAILTGADTACVIARTSSRACEADGRSAANAANVVFVPRLDFDALSVDVRGRAEAMLYTDFKLVEETALWQVWVRRGVTLQGSMLAGGAFAR